MSFIKVSYICLNQIIMFSKACEYGIKSALFISQNSKNGERVSLKLVAKAINSPEAFTAKILQLLVRNKIITSYKGPHGGFVILPDNVDKISVRRIVTAIDGDKIFTACALGLEKCNAKKPCPVHHKFKKFRDELEKMLDNTSLRDLSKGLSLGKTVLK